MNISRRKTLASIASVAGMSALAGCEGEYRDIESKFRLAARPVGDVGASPEESGTPLVDPLTIPADLTPDYSDEYKRSIVSKLVDSGSTAVTGWPLTYETEWGIDTRERPRCFEHGGSFYRIHLDDVTTDTDQYWQLGLQWQGPPVTGDADVRSLPLEELPEQDRRIINATAESIPEQNVRTGEARWGTFHTEFDPETSELISEPPFESLEYENEQFKLNVQKQPLDDLVERTLSIEPVADSRAAYERYARETLSDARYTVDSLSESAVSVLDEATSREQGFSYEEEPPLSEKLEAVLEPLGITGELREHDEYEQTRWFNDALAEYRGQWYRIDLAVYP